MRNSLEVPLEGREKLDVVFRLDVQLRELRELDPERLDCLSTDVRRLLHDLHHPAHPRRVQLLKQRRQRRVPVAPELDLPEWTPPRHRLPLLGGYRGLERG